MTSTAERMNRLGDETAFKIGDDIRCAEKHGKSVIRLNLGEPDFNSADNINAVAVENIQSGNSHYCDPQGILPLRESIAHTISTSRQVDIHPDQVVVTSGGKPPISYSILTYVNPGEEVIYPTPGFPIYESWINFAGAVLRPLQLKEENGFRFDLTNLRQQVSRKTKLIIINSPSNPTGGILSRGDLSAITQILKEKAHPQFRILSDEVYEKIIFDDRSHASILSESKAVKHTILMNSHSKTYAMTGWRIGYAVLPTIKEAHLFRQWNINTVSCVAPFIQEAARQALESPENEKIVARMVAKFEERRNMVVDALNRIPGISCANPAPGRDSF